MANSWGESGPTWSQGDWGQQNITTVVLSGLSITSSLGEVLSYPEEGWGRSTWGSDDWGDFSLTVFPTGYSITGSIGELAAASEQGWGRSTWGNEPWGDSNSPVVSVSGFSITGSLGTPYAAAEEGWGRDEWGYGNWGENTTTVILDGLEMTTGFGPDGWGRAPWDEMIGWGGDLTLTTTQLSIAELTGLEMTGSLGTLTLNYDFIFTLSDSLLLTASRGSLSINNGADHTQGLGGIAMTGSLGTPVLELGVPLTGIQATVSLGTEVATNTELVDITGIEATGSLGTLGSIDDMAIGLTGLSSTMSLGTPTVDDMAVGLTGLSITGSVGQNYVVAYADESITGSTAYSVDTHANTSYTVEKHIPN